MITGVVACSCGGPSRAGTPPARAKASPAMTITLYSGQHPETTGALGGRVRKVGTGVTVLVREDDEDVLANQIVEEGKNSPADVIYTENSQALQFLQTKGLLAPVAPSTLSRVAAPIIRRPANGWGYRPG